MMETETEDSNSNSSASPSHASVSHGLLKCLPKNDVIYYIFSWNGKDLGAKGWKLNCGREAFDWVYTFHSHEGNKKKSNRSRNMHSARKDDHDLSLITWMIKDDHALDLLGWMRASSSLCPELNPRHGSLEHTLETEFILFGASTQHTHKSTTDINSSGNFSNLFSGTSRSSSTISHHSTLQPVQRCMPTTDDIKKKMMNTKNSGHPLKSRCKDRCAILQENPRNSDMSEEEFWASQSFSSNVELAAIVIRTPFSQSKCVKDRNGKDSGGWGLKFLEKSSVRSRSKGKKSVEEGSSKAESSNGASVMGCDEQSLRVGNISCGKQDETSVTVMVPADAHGLPVVESCRPSSLIERWRFGGKCDCGGWDAGCTLTLFHNQKPNRNKLTAGNSEAEDSDVFRLFKGKQQDMPAFEMVDVNNDLYLISFRPELAALQVFAIAVALLNGIDPVIKCSMSSNASNDYIP